MLDLVKALRPRLDVPIVLMGYTNSFLAMGERNFPEAAREAGVDGVITVDCPPEEEPAFYANLEACGVDAILLAAPTTTEARLAMLARAHAGLPLLRVADGRDGRAHGPAAAPRRESRAHSRRLGRAGLRGLRRLDARAGRASSAQHADGVVVGSALVDRIARAASREAAIDDAAAFVAALKAPLRKPR